MIVKPWLFRLMAPKPWFGNVRGPEDVITLGFAADLRAWTLAGQLRATWTCIPHEVGYTSKHSQERGKAMNRYAKALAQGLIPGSGDYVFTWSDGSGWIEAKSKVGSLSPDQRDYLEWCKLTGTKYEVMKSRAQGAEILKSWGVLRI